MPRKDHHLEPYKESTVLKLKLFESFLLSWLGVFSQTPFGRYINIFDFFCGPGADLEDTKGSPLRAIDCIYSYRDNILKNEKVLFAFFGDTDSKKISDLKERISKVTTPKNTEILIEEIEFSEAFKKFYIKMQKSNTANFLFIDPNGLAVTLEIFKYIINLQYTDFLLFTPSSYIWRFEGEPRFKEFYPGIKRFTYNDTKNQHKHICDYYKDQVKKLGKKYYLAPFSIGSGSNIYGLIFGSNSLKGLEKFLESCWKHDPVNGEANFGLAGDIPDTGQLSLIETSRKKRNFEDFIRRTISSSENMNNHELYELTLVKGFLPKHTNEALRKLLKEGKLMKMPKISFKSLKSSPEIIIKQ
jgi:three-Cys-motif partner protein